MDSLLADATDEIRAALNEERREKQLSYRRQAAELDIPFQTLQAFCSGRLDLPDSVAFRRSLAGRFPRLVPRLEQLSLAWKDQPVGEPAATGPPVAPRS